MGPIKYSDGESLLLHILRKRKKPITSYALAELYYHAQGKPAPIHARSSIITTIRVLKRKMEENKESDIIIQSDQRGPHPATFQLRKEIR
jgi:hypothetical protein